ncbi:MAG: N-acetyltransferase family protein [Erythrobacter sp.]
MPDFAIRLARVDDALAICDIYDFHVAHGTASFDSAGPSEAEWAVKIAEASAQSWPFLVAECGGAVVGYAYAAQFRPRAAYARTCENSIYVADAARGQGIGLRLLLALVDAARSASVRARGVISGVVEGVFRGGACPTPECGVAGGHRAHRYGGVCRLQP